MPRLAASLALALLASPAAAQLVSFAGPAKAPLGCPIVLGFSNDTDQTYVHGICPFNVTDPGGALVFLPACPEIAKITPPGDSFHALWLQKDGGGSQVSPGVYTITVFLPDGSQAQHQVEIGPFDAAVAITGVPRVGKTRGFRLCAPGDGGLAYLMAASLTTQFGIPTCGGSFPLDADLLFILSLTTPSSFVSFKGTLDAAGESEAPQLAVPPNPTFAGLGFSVAFASLDPLAPCPVVSISEVTDLAVQ